MNLLLCGSFGNENAMNSAWRETAGLAFHACIRRKVRANTLKTASPSAWLSFHVQPEAGTERQRCQQCIVLLLQLNLPKPSTMARVNFRGQQKAGTNSNFVNNT